MPAATLLALLALPLAGAWLCLGLRAQPRLTTTLAAGVGTITLALWLALPDGMIQLLGLMLRLDPPRRMAGVALLAAVLLLLALDRLVGRGRKFAAVALAVAGAGAGTLLLADARAGAVCLLGASAAVLFALLDRPLLTPGEDSRTDLPSVPALEAALKYLALMVLAAVAFVVAFVVLDRYRVEPEQEARIKLVLGFLGVALALRLGVAPLHAWVGDVLVATPPAAAGLVLVAVNGITVFFAAEVFAGAPLVLSANLVGRDLLLTGAVISVGLAGLLAWSRAVQSDVRRLVGAAAVAGVGYSLFGLGVATPAGFSGALLGSLAGGAGLLLAIGAAGLLVARHGTADPTALAGLGWRAPLLPLALALGLAMLLGVPPLGAVAGRLLVLQAAASYGAGWPWAGGLLAGLTLLGAALLRALRPLWAGHGLPDGVGSGGREVPAVALWLGTLAVIGLLAGLYPAPALDLLAQWATTVTYLVRP